MARSSTPSIIGIILVIVGAGAGVWAWQQSQTLGNKVASTLTGDASNDVIVATITGVICLVAGLVLLFRRD